MAVEVDTIDQGEAEALEPLIIAPCPYLNDANRQRVLNVALAHLKGAPPRLRASLEQALRVLEIRGFTHHPLMCPRPLLTRELATALMRPGRGLFEKPLLALWIDAQPSLKAACEQFLWASADVIREAVSRLQAKDSSFGSTLLDSLTTRFVNEVGGHDQNDARLMLYCLYGRLIARELLSETRGGTVTIEVTEEPLASMWTTLQALPAEARAWDQVPTFIELLQALHAARHETRQTGTRLADRLEALQKVPAACLDFFDIGELAAASPDDFEPSGWPAVASSLEELCGQLNEWRAVHEARGKTRDEERDRRERVDALEEQILQRIDLVRGQLKPPPPDDPKPLPPTSGDEEDASSSASTEQTREAFTAPPESALVTVEVEAPDSVEEATLSDLPAVEAAAPSAEETAEPSDLPVEEGDEPLAPQAPLESPVTEPETPMADGGLAEQGARTSSDDGAVGETPKEITSEEVVELIWMLAADGKCALAHHLAALLGPEGGGQAVAAPTLLRALTLTPHLASATGDIARALIEDFLQMSEVSLEQETPAETMGVNLLMAAAALRPSILAPSTGAPSLLHRLHVSDGLNELYHYCKTIASYGDRLRPLDANALQKVRGRVGWQHEVDQIVAEAKAWWSQAPSFSLVYAPATMVWRRWVETDGLVHQLIQTVLSNDWDKAETVREVVNRLSTEDNFRREVAATDHKRLKRRIAGINYMALGQLHHHLEEALSLASRWLQIHDSRPSGSRDHLHQLVEDLGRDVLTTTQVVAKELDAYALRDAANFMVSAGVACCRRAIQSVRDLFDPSAPAIPPEPDVADLLFGPLLRMPGLLASDGWRVTGDGKALATLVEAVSGAPARWNEVLSMHLKSGDLEAASRLVSYLERQPSDEQPDLDGMRAQISRALEECRASLKRDLEDTRKRVEAAVAYGLLRERDRLAHAATLETIELRLASLQSFRPQHEELRAIRDKLAALRKSEIAAARRELEGSSLPVDSPARARIEHVLDTGDVLTATEYLEMALSGQPLPETRERADAFLDFFEKKLPGLVDHLKNTNMDPRATVDRVLQGNPIGPLQMKHADTQEARSASELLKLWLTMKRVRQADGEAMRTMLTHLGFRVLELGQRREARRTWFDLTTQPVEDRDRCPVAAFGSAARGRYRLLCVWEQPTEDDLVNDVGDSHRSPVIVFHFGEMSAQRRRDLARLCREKRRTFVVVDDLLVYYLSSVRGARLPVLFECTTPFTYVEPYTTTAGLVPPEMFYGRQTERDKIISPEGTCFIYGGRQLGKTVLLRDVERRFHSPKHGRLAAWIDLKAEGIGFDRSMDDIAQILALELRRKSGNALAISQTAGLDAVLKRLEKWLTDDEARRILLLLDEADRFLEIDSGQHFTCTTRLKGLMDRTHRRFKVVFAGLHNVQRTTRLENHPLAHYGNPICIGPLLDNGEWREARALVERPFATIGYRFVSPDLVTRILSQTNYYPSLLQLYCQQLLHHVNTRHLHAFNPKSTPPFQITFQHVAEAYQSQDLRKQIRNRFEWTLQLDRRYEVIAYAIAHSFFYDSEVGKRDGYSVSWIREQALAWWPQGFHSDSSQECFRALLDEMVGLGILRPVKENQYTLRSPNVVFLMGTLEEVEAALLDFGAREAPPDYEPSTFRRVDAANHTQRSPLTARQESTVLGRESGVAVVVGSKASGLEQVLHFLRLSIEESRLVVASGLADAEAFHTWLSTLVAGKLEEGTTMVVVPSDLPWDSAWVAAADKRLKRFSTIHKIVRVAFLGSAATTWRMVSDDGSVALPDVVPTCSLRPWNDAAVRSWLEACGFGPRDAQDRLRLAEVTGNWPALLYSFVERTGGKAHRWDEAMRNMHALWREPGNVERWLVDLGMRPEVRRVLHDLAQVGQATEDDLVGLIDDIRLDELRRILRWADLLSIVTAAGDGRWQVDPLVGRLLEMRSV